MNARFENKTIVVTGAASGIGAATTRLFLEEGATVFAADVATDGMPTGARAIVADVTDPHQVETLISTALEATAHLDIVCNNAGIGSTADPISCTPEEWDRVFAVNARGVFLGTKYALPLMLERGEGVIVNTASVAGLIGLRDRTAYCASKGAVIAFTKQVAAQYAHRGIRCNCVCPGTVDSPWVANLTEAAADPAAARQALIARQPLGRLAQPFEIAQAIAYLASDAAAFITGAALIIDGGIMASISGP